MSFCNKPRSNTFHSILTGGTNGDIGTMETGASGAPQLNPSGRVIANVLHGFPPEDCETLIPVWATRIEFAWDGTLSTSSTRLSDWLGGLSTPKPFFINTLKQPIINGTTVLCDVPQNYSLTNVPIDQSVSWTASPANLLASATAGTGTTTTLQAKNSTVQGFVTLTYTLQSVSCGTTASISKEIWVGKPTAWVYLQNLGTHCKGEQYQGFVQVTGSYNAVKWSSTGVVKVVGGINSETVSYIVTGAGWGSICANIVNECGLTTVCQFVQATNQDCDKYGSSNLRLAQKQEDIQLIIAPNPINNLMILSFQAEDFKSLKQIRVINSNGQIVKSFSTQNEYEQIDTSKLASGLYFIECKIGDRVLHKKVIKR